MFTKEPILVAPDLDENGSRCTRLYDGWSAIYGV